MFTQSTAAAPAGLPDFDVVAVYLSVALFHWMVCLGFDAVATFAMVIVPTFRRASRRLNKGICLVARDIQLAVLPPNAPLPKQLLSLTPLVPTATATATATATTITKPSPALSASAAPARLPDFDVVAIYLSVALFHWIVCLGFDAVDIFTTAIAPIFRRASRRATKGILVVTRAIQHAVLPHSATLPKQLLSLAPLVPTVTTITKLSPALPATTNCGTHSCVLLTTSTGPALQRANASRARDILHDLGVAFREIDAAETPLELVRRFTQVSKTHGVYPQVFLEPIETPFDDLLCVSFAQLEQMEFFAKFTVPTTNPKTTSMSISITHDTIDAMYPTWLVYASCGWGDYNFEDVWDFFTAMKLYTLMP